MCKCVSKLFFSVRFFYLTRLFTFNLFYFLFIFFPNSVRVKGLPSKSFFLFFFFLFCLFYNVLGRICHLLLETDEQTGRHFVFRKKDGCTRAVHWSVLRLTCPMTYHESTNQTQPETKKKRKENRKYISVCLSVCEFECGSLCFNTYFCTKKHLLVGGCICMYIYVCFFCTCVYIFTKNEE